MRLEGVRNVAAQELETVTKKLEKLRAKYQQVKTDIEDMKAENQRERAYPLLLCCCH